MEAKRGQRRSIVLRTPSGQPRPEPAPPSGTSAHGITASTLRPAPRARTPKPAPTPRPTRQPVVSKRERDRAATVTAYLNGDRVSDIAARLDRSPTTVRTWLRAAGIEPPAREYPVRVRPCAGGCGRLTRPASTTVEQCPGTVARAAGGKCSSCHEKTSSRRAINDDELKRIVELYDTGLTAPQIGEQLGRTSKTIRTALDRAGVTRVDGRSLRSGGRPKTANDDPPDLAKAVVDAYTAGKTITQIEQTIPGVGSATHARGILMRAGVSMRPPANKPTDLDARARAVQLATQTNLTHSQIGAQLGYAQTTISRWIREHDHPTTTNVALADTAPPATHAPAPADGDDVEADLPPELLALASSSARAVVSSLLDAAAALAETSRHVAVLVTQTRAVLDQLGQDTTEVAP
nr:helix-turn-helix domain-containing protein [Cellulomonas uda]